LLFAFSTAWAGYELEVGIPNQTGAEKGDAVGLAGYIRAIYLFALGAVGAAALLTLVISGLIYMLSDTVFSKEQAKDYIWGAIGGIVLAFAAYLILFTINPDLVKINPPGLEIELPEAAEKEVEVPYRTTKESEEACKNSCLPGKYVFDPVTKNCSCEILPGPEEKTKTCWCDRYKCYSSENKCPLFLGVPNCNKTIVPASTTCE